MAESTARGSTRSSGDAQGRFVVSLPKELGPVIDKLSTRIGEAVREQTGVAVELNRAQVVQSLVKSAIDRAESDAPAAE